MTNLTGRSVTMVRIAEVTHVQGLGQVGPTIDKDSAKVLNGLRLTRTDGGVYIEGKDHKGSPIEFEIPIGNIKVIIYKQVDPNTL